MLTTCRLHLELNFTLCLLYLKASQVACLNRCWCMFRHNYGILLLDCDAHCLSLKFRCFHGLWQVQTQLRRNNQQSTIKIATHYTTLSLSFEDWYLDWKIDNSIGTGLLVPKLHSLYFPQSGQTSTNNLTVLGSLQASRPWACLSSPYAPILMVSHDGSSVPKIIAKYCPKLLCHSKLNAIELQCNTSQ